MPATPVTRSTLSERMRRGFHFCVQGGRSALSTWIEHNSVQLLLLILLGAVLTFILPQTRYAARVRAFDRAHPCVKSHAIRQDWDYNWKPVLVTICDERMR